jgi:hypothetical protein
MKKLLYLIILLLYTFPAYAGPYNLIVVSGGGTAFTQDANAVGAWYMNGASASNETDRTSNGNTLTQNNSPQTSANVPTGFTGKSRTTGGSSFLNHADGGSLDINGGTAVVTVAAWIYCTGAPTSGNFGGVVTKWNATGNQKQYALSIYGTGSSQFSIRGLISGDGSTTHYTESTTTTYAQSTWYHIAVVDNNIDIRVYVNGSLANASPTAHTTGIFNGTQYFSVGDLGGANLFNGQIDEPIVFNRALSASEILAIYNNGISGNKGGSD